MDANVPKENGDGPIFFGNPPLSRRERVKKKRTVPIFLIRFISRKGWLFVGLGLVSPE
jgi:hypothetical protein